MSRCFTDHLVIVSPSLESGAAFIIKTLGVEPQTGGEHPRMGTHNLLVRLGEMTYLEVLAPNPDAPSPGRPRWFGLDDLRPDSEPSLSTWVVRTTDIVSKSAASSEPLGNVESMSRGDLNWLLTIPADGVIPLNGVAPAVIEWHTDVHPASRMEDAGLSLAKLEIFHPEPARVSRLLSSINLDGPFLISASLNAAAPHLVAHINTPWGPRRLSVHK